MSSKLVRIIFPTLLCVVAATGCTKKERPVPATKPSEQPSVAKKLTGEQLFREKCASCHKVGDNGGAAGPDLTGIGARRDAAALQQSIRNQRKNNPSTIMPPFEDLSAEELQALTNYLASLK